MQVDLTNGSGWPAGGVHISLADGLQTLEFTEHRVRGGTTLDITLSRPQPGTSDYFFGLLESTVLPFSDFYNFPAEYADVLTATAYGVLGGRRSANPMNLADALLLDESSAVSLDAFRDGRNLRWHAPDGDWVIVVSWLMPVGAAPVLVANESPGYVLDHLRREVVTGNYEYLFGGDRGLQKYYGNSFRGFFNDSIEFTANRLARSDIFDEFQRRRGYDVKPLVATLAVEAVDNFYFREAGGMRPAPEYQFQGALDERIRYDYQRTVSDIIMDEFVEASSNWAHQRGLMSRAQTYGMDVDSLQGMAIDSIPETEQLFAGGGEMGLKLPASAAILHGKPLVAAESFVWAGRSHGTTPRKVKAAADKLFISGVNHIIYHGVPYEWHAGEPGSVFAEEGWYPFSSPESDRMSFSSFISPTNPLWPGFEDLNQYLARAQNLLQAGTADSDVLIWYPFLGFPSSYSGSEVGATEPLFGGKFPDAEPGEGHSERGLAGVFPDAGPDPRVAWLEDMQVLTESLNARGITWSWVSSHALQTGALKPGVTEGGAHYKQILLANVEAIDPADMEALLALQANGQPITVYGSMPVRTPGYKDHAENDRKVKAGVAKLMARGAENLRTIEQWKGFAALLGRGDKLRYVADSKIRIFKRREEGTGIYFLSNPYADTETLTLALQDETAAWWYSATDNTAWPVSVEKGVANLSLEGYESRFLIVGRAQPLNLPINHCSDQQTATEKVLAEWQVPELDNQLVDWQAKGQESRATPMIYKTYFIVDDTSGVHQLDLGLLHGMATVAINGRDAGLVATPPMRKDISRFLKAGRNRLEVSVTQAMRNTAIAKGVAGDARYAQMRHFDGQWQAAGLLGPVTLRHCAP